MRKLLGHTLALALATALVVTAWTFVLSRTLGSASYLERQADQTQLYRQLSTALPEAGLHPDDLAAQVHALLPPFRGADPPGDNEHDDRGDDDDDRHRPFRRQAREQSAEIQGALRLPGPTGPFWAESLERR